jgi:predicted RNase H-like nuclease
VTKKGKRPKPLVLGVDGVRGRWVAVALRGRRIVDARVVPTLAEAIESWPEAEAIGVDTPIGLPSPALDDPGHDAAGIGFPRRADVAARELLVGAASRVFTAYPREVYLCETHAEATACAQRLVGQGCSQQAWRLRTAILDAETVSADQRVFEAHPELSFLQMRGEVLRPKTTWQGVAERIDALRLEGIDVPLDHDAAHAPAADVLDATAVAWSARRKLRGKALRVPRGTDPTMPTIWV